MGQASHDIRREGTTLDNPIAFEFGGGSVARDYDQVLVPMLFEPWARRLVEVLGPCTGLTVLDLATGTGVVARMLARRVGPGGRVIGVDINAEMAALAELRCADVADAVEVHVAPAADLPLPDDAVDRIVCQQGYQFFPDREAAAGEMWRVLKPGGRLLMTVWRSVDECDYFGAICGALRSTGADEIAAMMETPFPRITAEELAAPLASAGFTSIETQVDRAALAFDGGASDGGASDRGIDQVVATSYATPIGPKLRQLPEAAQATYRAALTQRLRVLADGGDTLGTLSANLIRGEKPA